MLLHDVNKRRYPLDSVLVLPHDVEPVLVLLDLLNRLRFHTLTVLQLLDELAFHTVQLVDVSMNVVLQMGNTVEELALVVVVGHVVCGIPHQCLCLRSESTVAALRCQGLC